MSEPIPMLLWCPSCGARHVDAGEFATKPHHTQSAMTAKNRRRKVESVCFVVTGEFVTSHARDLVLSDQPSSAWRFIVETLLGDGIETPTFAPPPKSSASAAAKPPQARRKRPPRR